MSQDRPTGAPGTPQTWSKLGRTATFGAAMALAGVVAVFAYLSSRELVNSVASVDRTLSVMRALDRFTSVVRNAEIGHRGYVLTGDPDYRIRYEAALPEIGPAVDDLLDLTKRKPAQLQLAHELGATSRRWIDAAGEVVATERRPVSAGAGVGELDYSRRVMEEVRALVGALRAQEDKLYAERRAEARRQAATSGSLVLAAVTVSLAAILGAFLMLRREALRREAAQEALAQANSGLEAEVARRTAELEAEAEKHLASAETLQAIIEESPAAIIALDPARRVTVWNGAAERAFGWTAIGVVGEPLPLARSAADDPVRVLLDRLTQGERVRNLPLSVPRHDGSMAEVMASGAALLGREGEMWAFVLLLEDLSQRRVLEQQLAQANRLEAVGQLTGGMAHDFNNLLSIVIGNLDLLLERIESNPDAASLAGEAQEAALRGAELVRQLLAFARRQTLLPTVVNLNQRLPTLVSMLRRTLGETVTVVSDPAAMLHDVRVDRTMLENAIVNLALNARDAMPSGGRLTIETDEAHLDEEYAAQYADLRPGRYVMLAVTDTGTGMPPEIIERAFEPFFTTKEEGRGTGLGLSMVYGFVKQSGGHLRIYSEMGRGTTVKLYLPRVAAQEHEPEAGEVSVPFRGNGERILVVEDQPSVRAVAVRQLENLGYAIVEAGDVGEALALLERETVDLVFTDIVMPGGLTGFDLAAEIEARWPETGIVFTSGYTARGARSDRNGDDRPLLSKPYRRSDLAAAIHRALRGDEGNDRNR